MPVRHRPGSLRRARQRSFGTVAVPVVRDRLKRCDPKENDVSPPDSHANALPHFRQFSKLSGAEHSRLCAVAPLPELWKRPLQLAVRDAVCSAEARSAEKTSATSCGAVATLPRTPHIPTAVRHATWQWSPSLHRGSRAEFQPSNELCTYCEQAKQRVATLLT